MTELPPELRDKIKAASTIIDNVLDTYKNPALLCSFGKDSLLLLYMIKNWFRPIPVVFFDLPWFARKRAFAHQVIADMELEVYSPPPVGFSICSGNGKSEVVYHYRIGQNVLQMPLGQQNLTLRSDWLCGLQTILRGPFGTLDWPWDVAFCGHKGSDKDPVRGEVPLQTDVHQIANSCHLAYPLRHFTDEDVWACHKAYGLPKNELRYQEGKEDSIENFWNDDYIPYCNKCFDPNQPPFVICPKNGLEITNIQETLAKSPTSFLYCGSKGT